MIMRRCIFLVALLLAFTSALPTPPADGKPAASASPPKEQKGLFAAAKRFFASFNKAKNTNTQHGFGPYGMLAGPGKFMTEFKKMNTWWCAQPGHAEQRMCMNLAGKKVDPKTPTAKAAPMSDIRKAYCAIEGNKESQMCKMHYTAQFAGAYPQSPAALARARAAALQAK